MMAPRTISILLSRSVACFQRSAQTFCTYCELHKAV